MEMMFTGRVIKSQEAKEIGLVNVATDGDAYAVALEMAHQIVSNAGPVALQMAKKSAQENAGFTVAEALQVERECYSGVLHT